MRVILSDRPKKCDGLREQRISTKSRGKLLLEKRKKKKENLSRGTFFGLFCLYISQVCYRTLLNEREGWTRKSGQVRSGLAGHAVPTGTYIGTLPTLLVALLLHVYTG